MPKDREKYRYIDVGLERGSWALAMFEEDARRHHMSDQPGKLMALRLTEFYELKKEREASVSRELLQRIENDHSLLPRSSGNSRHISTIHASADNVLEISQQETENADEAADYWGGI
jgi:hypothetical protein